VGWGECQLRTLFIDNNSRNPKARGPLQLVDNLIYEWGRFWLDLG
jgi:hypothetical protein